MIGTARGVTTTVGTAGTDTTTRTIIPTIRTTTAVAATIRAIVRGTVRDTEGTVEFDDTVLAFPLMADGRLSPLSGPWVVLKAIRSGCILAAGREGELVHVTIDDSYADNALTVDLWLEEGQVEEAEIAWEGRRCLSISFDDFSA